MFSKQILRKEQKLLFKTLDKTTLKSEQEGIVDTILNSNDFKSARNIGIYLSLSDEVCLNEVIEKSWQEGKSIYIPKVEGESINFYKIKNWKDLEQGKFGILEPNENCKKLDNSLDIIYIPGQIFTKTGKRIGRGKGYYDRFLSLSRDLIKKKVGVCFGHQIRDDFETDEWDIIMDEVVFNFGYS